MIVDIEGAWPLSRVPLGPHDCPARSPAAEAFRTAGTAHEPWRRTRVPGGALAAVHLRADARRPRSRVVPGYARSRCIEPPLARARASSIASRLSYECCTLRQPLGLSASAPPRAPRVLRGSLASCAMHAACLLSRRGVACAGGERPPPDRVRPPPERAPLGNEERVASGWGTGYRYSRRVRFTTQQRPLVVVLVLGESAGGWLLGWAHDCAPRAAQRRRRGQAAEWPLWMALL